MAAGIEFSFFHMYEACIKFQVNPPLVGFADIPSNDLLLYITVLEEYCEITHAHDLENG
jgi:hypothetical protein